MQTTITGPDGTKYRVSTNASGRGVSYTMTFRVGLPPTLRTMALRTLELPADASYDQARARFRELVKTHHPDQGGEAEDFHRIKKAWELLEQGPW